MGTLITSLVCRLSADVNDSSRAEYHANVYGIATVFDSCFSSY